MKKGQTKLLINHTNKSDETRTMTFTSEDEANNSMSFLDAWLTYQEDGSVKSTVYHRSIHMDQYLNFTSYHPQTTSADQCGENSP